MGGGDGGTFSYLVALYVHEEILRVAVVVDVAVVVVVIVAVVVVVVVAVVVAAVL